MGDMLGDWGFVRDWIVGFIRLCCDFLGEEMIVDRCIFNTNFVIIYIYQIIITKKTTMQQ
jgi:hypothetical protein